MSNITNSTLDICNNIIDISNNVLVSHENLNTNTKYYTMNDAIIISYFCLKFSEKFMFNDEIKQKYLLMDDVLKRLKNKEVFDTLVNIKKKIILLNNISNYDDYTLSSDYIYIDNSEMNNTNYYNVIPIVNPDINQVTMVKINNIALIYLY